MAQAWMVQARRRQAHVWRDTPAAGALRWGAAEGLADWLAQYEWDRFNTFTTGHVRGEESMLRLHRRWTVEVEHLVGHQLRQAVFLEAHKDGRPHLHALEFGTGGCSGECRERRPCDACLGLQVVWEQVAGGIARCHPFAPGAAEYCSKATRYASKEGRMWFRGPWSPVQLRIVESWRGASGLTSPSRSLLV